METKYKEIHELYEYCLKIGVEAKISPLYDGYVIRFKNGDDFIQHSGSYGHEYGCVEPAIRCRLDYAPVQLKQAKALVKYHKDRLNRGG